MQSSYWESRPALQNTKRRTTVHVPIILYEQECGDSNVSKRKQLTTAPIAPLIPGWKITSLKLTSRSVESPCSPGMPGIPGIPGGPIGPGGPSGGGIPVRGHMHKYGPGAENRENFQGTTSQWGEILNCSWRTASCCCPKGKSHGVSWVVPYDDVSLAELFRRLFCHKMEANHSGLLLFAQLQEVHPLRTRALSQCRFHAHITWSNAALVYFLVGERRDCDFYRPPLSPARRSLKIDGVFYSDFSFIHHCFKRKKNRPHFLTAHVFVVKRQETCTYVTLRKRRERNCRPEKDETSWTSFSMQLYACRSTY